MPPKPPPRDSGSTLRLVAGLVMLMLGFALALTGFLRLVIVLEGGGYGTSAMTTALVVLGAAGACFSTGIATLIWHVAKRYERR